MTMIKNECLGQVRLAQSRRDLKRLPDAGFGQFQSSGSMIIVEPVQVIVGDSRPAVRQSKLRVATDRLIEQANSSEKSFLRVRRVTEGSDQFFGLQKKIERFQIAGWTRRNGRLFFR